MSFLRKAFLALLLLAGCALGLYWCCVRSQSVWEVRVDGTDGLIYEGCISVTSREWWRESRVQAELAPQTVPSTSTFKALDFSASLNPVSPDGFMRVTILRDGTVVDSYEFEPGTSNRKPGLLDLLQ